MLKASRRAWKKRRSNSLLLFYHNVGLLDFLHIIGVWFVVDMTEYMFELIASCSPFFTSFISPLFSLICEAWWPEKRRTELTGSPRTRVPLDQLYIDCVRWQALWFTHNVDELPWFIQMTFKNLVTEQNRCACLIHIMSIYLQMNACMPVIYTCKCRLGGLKVIVFWQWHMVCFTMFLLLYQIHLTAYGDINIALIL